MAPKCGHVLLAMLSLLLVVVPILAAHKGIVGTWMPIKDPKAPAVVEIAKFAVKEHNTEKKTVLILDSVIRGEMQVVSGTNYRLVISTSIITNPADTPKIYTAVVYQGLDKKTLKLISFA